MAYYPGSVPNNGDFSKPRDVVENSTTGIVGGSSQIALAPVALKVGEVESALRKEGTIVLWGRLTYNDIYEQKTEHVVTFCPTLTPSQNKGNPLIVFAATPLRGECNQSK